MLGTSEAGAFTVPNIGMYAVPPVDADALARLWHCSRCSFLVGTDRGGDKVPTYAASPPNHDAAPATSTRPCCAGCRNSPTICTARAGAKRSAMRCR